MSPWSLAPHPRPPSPGRRGAALLLAASVLACAGLGHRQDFDPTADFSRLHTFAWYPSLQARAGDLRRDAPELDRRIREAVDQVLRDRGYRRIDRGRPDFFVDYYLSLDRDTDVQTVDARYVWNHSAPGRNSLSAGPRVRSYQRGTLVIDVSDALAEKLVWRGWSASRLAGTPDPVQQGERVDAAVDEILAQFPPRT